MTFEFPFATSGKMGEGDWNDIIIMPTTGSLSGHGATARFMKIYDLSAI